MLSGRQQKDTMADTGGLLTNELHLKSHRIRVSPPGIQGIMKKSEGCFLLLFWISNHVPTPTNLSIKVRQHVDTIT